MLDLDFLCDYIQDDCVVDIYDCDSNNYDCIKKDLSIDEVREWGENHSCEIYSIEPIQRKDNNGETIFGLVINVGKVEEN